MKVSIKGEKYQFTLVTIVAETVEVSKGALGGSIKEIKAVAYVFDKERKAFKFLADQIERYD